MLGRGVLKKIVRGFERDLPIGTIVFRYSGNTYGAISKNGIAVTLKQDQTPFFEVPKDAVEWEKSS